MQCLLDLAPDQRLCLVLILDERKSNCASWTSSLRRSKRALWPEGSWVRWCGACKTNMELMYGTVEHVPDVIRPQPMSGTCSDHSIHRRLFLGASHAAPSRLQSARISAQIDKQSYDDLVRQLRRTTTYCSLVDHSRTTQVKARTAIGHTRPSYAPIRLLQKIGRAFEERFISSITKAAEIIWRLMVVVDSSGSLV